MYKTLRRGRAVLGMGSSSLTSFYGLVIRTTGKRQFPLLYGQIINSALVAIDLSLSSISARGERAKHGIHSPTRTAAEVRLAELEARAGERSARCKELTV
jgi:hypothetical protein